MASAGCVWCSRVFRLWPGIVFHSRGPFHKAEQLLSLAPQETPKFYEPDFVHLKASVGFDSPANVWTAPGGEAVPSRGYPDEPKNPLHGILSISGLRDYSPRGVFLPSTEGQTKICKLCSKAGNEQGILRIG